MLRRAVKLSVSLHFFEGKLLTPFFGLERVASNEWGTYQKLLLGELDLVGFFRASFRLLNKMTRVRIPYFDSVSVRWWWWWRWRTSRASMMPVACVSDFMPAMMIDSIDRICDRQRPQIDSFISVELETGISINHDSTGDLKCVSHCSKMGLGFSSILVSAAFGPRLRYQHSTELPRELDQHTQEMSHS
jgi:hypothetical protein